MKKGKLNIFSKLKANPKQIFLVDAFGAFLTAVILFGVFLKFEKYFGMPGNILFVLSGWAFCLFVFSIGCHRFIKSNWKPFLRIIIVCNVIYTMVSLRLIIMHAEKLTGSGWIYFLLEIIVIGTIVSIEIQSYLNQHQL